jgi:hypothetical protein
LAWLRLFTVNDPWAVTNIAKGQDRNRASREVTPHEVQTPKVNNRRPSSLLFSTALTGC